MRGTVEIYPGDTGFIVMEWSRGGDSGWQVGSYHHRWQACSAAVRHARERGLDLPSAEVIAFPNRGAE